MKDLRKIIYIASLGLMLLPVKVGAQNKPAAFVDTSAVHTHGMRGFSSFDPAVYQVQKRYRPMEGDTAFSKQWWRNITFGFSSGIETLHNFAQTTAQVPFNGYVGYRFTPVHELRLQAGSESMKVKGDGKSSYKTFNAEIQYLASLSNFAFGYNPKRLINVNTLLAVGVRHYSSNGMVVEPDADEALQGKNPTTPYLQHTIAPYAKAGFDIDFRLGPNVNFFVQPFFGVMRNQFYTFDDHLHDKYEVYGGVHAGIAANLQPSQKYYEEMAPMYRSFFFEAGTGWNYGLNRIDPKFSGNSYWLGLGRWVDPGIGFRVTFGGSQGYWNKNEKDFQFRKSNVNVGARAELLLGLLNFSQKRRHSLEDPTFDLNLSAGVQVGYETAYSPYNASVDYVGSVETVKKGVRGTYYGFTSGLQGLLKVSPGSYIFAEPRFTYLTYNKPYSYLDASTGLEKLVKGEGFMDFSVGARIYGATKSIRMQNDSAFVPHWWAAADFGGMKLYQAHRAMGEGMKMQPAFGLSVGYDLHPFATFRFQTEYQIYSRGNDLVNPTFNTKFHMLDFRAMYMLSITNLMRGVDSHNRFQVYWETGPTLSIYTAQNSNLLDHKGQASPGWMTGMMMAYRVKPRWDIFSEVQGQWNFRNNFTSPETEDKLRKFQNWKYGLYVGARYHFTPWGAEDLARLSMSVPDNMKGWFFEAGMGWSKPFGHQSGNMYKVSFGRWLSYLFAVRAGIRGQQHYYTVAGDPSNEYQGQVAGAGHIELLTSVLNWFPKFREQQDRLFDVNLFAGVQAGVQAANRTDNVTAQGSITRPDNGQEQLAHASNERRGFVGFTAGVQGLVRVAPQVQVYVEPSISQARVQVSKYLLKGNNVSNYPFTISAGTRITRPDDARAKIKAGYKGEDMEDNFNTMFKPGFWLALQVGGSKQFLCEKYINADKKGLTTIQPTFSASLGYDFTPLHTLRLQVENAWMNKDAYNADGSHYTMTDARLLYMLNFTNLWRGTRNNPRFGFYPEVGIGYSHKSYASREDEGFKHPKSAIGAVLGAMATYRFSKDWDVLVESQIQQNFGTQFYMNQDHNGVDMNDFMSNARWNVTVGTRYHMPSDKEDFARMNLLTPSYLKGWFFEGSMGWAKPVGHESGNMYKVSFGRWLNALVAVRAGLRMQQHFTHENGDPDNLYQGQSSASGHIEVVTDVLNWFPSLRAKAKEKARLFDLNLFAGVVAGMQGSNRSTVASDASAAGPTVYTGKGVYDVEHKNEYGSFIGLTAGIQGLVRVAPNVQLFVEPSILTPKVKAFSKGGLQFDSYRNYPFTISAGTRILRPDDARALRQAGYVGDAEEGGLSTEFKRGWWFGLEAGGAKQFLCEKTINSDASGLKGIQPSISFSAGYDFTTLHTLRAQVETSIMNKQPYAADGKHYNMTDVRLLYMLNFTNLWRGTRIRPVFSFYPEFGVSFSHKTYAISDYSEYNKKNAIGVVAGAMAAYRIARDWDVTVESEFQENLGTKMYMNQHHDKEFNSKWNVLVGTRYHLPAGKDEWSRMHLLTPDYLKGWFFEGSLGWAKPFGHESGNMYKASFGRWLNALVAVRAGVRMQQHFTHEDGDADNLYQGQVSASGHIELVTNVLNWFPSLRANKEQRTFDLNLFAGLVGGTQGSNRTAVASDPSAAGPSVDTGKGTYDVEHKNEYGAFVGLTAGIQALVKVAPNVQLFVEPSILTPKVKQFTKGGLQFDSYRNYPFTISAGTRILRPDDARALRQAGYKGDAEEGGLSTEFKPGWWVGLEVGGAKQFLCEKTIVSDSKGLKGIQPTFSLNAAYEFSSLHTLRGQVEMSFMNKQPYAPDGTHYNMTDFRLLYMLNFTNLWRGTRIRPVFSFYPEVGLGFSHKSYAIGEIPEYQKKSSFGLVAGAMGAYRVGKSWDLTIETQIQDNLGTKMYMNQHHDKEFNAKWNVTVGTRYYLPRGKDEIARLHLATPDYMKGWFLEAGMGWAKPFGHEGGNMYKVSFGRWINSLLGVRAGVRAQQHFTHYKEDADNLYQGQVSGSGHIEVLTDVLNWFPSLRADDDRKFDLNLYLGLVAGIQGSNRSNVASDISYAGNTTSTSVGGVYDVERANEFGGFVGFSAGIQALYKIAPGVQIYVEPSILSPKVTGFDKGGLQIDAYRNYPFTISAGTRITRSDDARTLRQGGYNGDRDENGISTEFKPNWWVALELGGAKQFLCEKYTGKGGIGVNPSFSVSAGRDLTTLSTVRFQVETSFLSKDPYEAGKGRYNVTDFRLLYMLNFTNLWRGTRVNPFFSIYPEVGLGYSIKNYCIQPSEYWKKSSFGIVAGALGAFRVNKSWDVTIESQIHENFTKCYLNQHHDKEGDAKWNFMLGTRFHF